MIRLVCCGGPDKSGVVQTFHLLTERKYTVGRKSADITLIDESVSRTHAEIVVEHPAGNITMPLLTPTVTVEDIGSKFGTFLTEENISDKIAANPREKITLSVGDKMRFGLQWNVYKIEYTSFVVTTSSMTPTQEFKDQIVKLGGHYVNEWNHHVTHVVMEFITLTVKVVCALLSAKPIVTPAYLSDLLAAYETKAPLPNPNNYVPQIKEAGISRAKASDFYPNPGRAALFAGKTFLFCSARHLRKLQGAVEAGGGTAKTLLNALKDNVATDEFICMGNPMDISDAEKDDRVKAVLDLYRKNGKRFIADSELGLAALHNSIEKYCNPSFSIKNATLPHLTTQTQSSSSSNSQNIREIPETQPSDTQPSSNGDTSRNVVNETAVNQNQSNDDVMVIIEPYPEKKSSSVRALGESVSVISETQASDTQKSSKSNASRNVVNESEERDSDDEIVEIEPDAEMESSSSSTRSAGLKRSLRSESLTSKKRPATDTLSRPESKRLKDASPAPSSSRQTRSSATGPNNSTKKLTSLFNFSDSEDEEKDARVSVPESQVKASDDEHANVVPDSEPPLVNVRNIRDLQSVSRSQSSSIGKADEHVFLVPPSPPCNEDEETINGTDHIDTVRNSVMNAKTVPVNEVPIESMRPSRAKPKKEREMEMETDPEEGTSAGGRKRRRDSDEDSNSLVEKCLKMDIKEDIKDEKFETNEQGDEIITAPLIRIPLVNQNISRLETSILANLELNARSVQKNFKCFKKVLPAFLAGSVASSGQGGSGSSRTPTNGLNGSSKSLRLVSRVYHPGKTGDYFAEREPRAANVVSSPPRFEAVDDDGLSSLINPIVEASTSRNNRPKRTTRGNKANGEQEANEDNNEQKRTSPRKRVARVVPPQPEFPQEMEAQDHADGWHF